MKKSPILIPAIFIVIVVITVIYIFLKSDRNTQQVALSPSPVASTASSYLLQGGSSYLDSNAIYSFLYPNDYIIDSSDSLQVRVYKTGPTQKGQTEMYDGVIVNFGKVSLNGKSLSDWIDNSIDEATSNGIAEVIQAKVPTRHNNYPGFSYSLRGLGVSKYMVVQKDINSDYAIIITTLVSDPTNIGFQKEVDDILSTLQILK